MKEVLEDQKKVDERRGTAKTEGRRTYNNRGGPPPAQPTRGQCVHMDPTPTTQTHAQHRE